MYYCYIYKYIISNKYITLTAVTAKIPLLSTTCRLWQDQGPTSRFSGGQTSPGPFAYSKFVVYSTINLFRYEVQKMLMTLFLLLPNILTVYSVRISNSQKKVIGIYPRLPLATMLYFMHLPSLHWHTF